ncbi:MAG TPA: aspartate kinase [Fibrobacteraceae bacterium]|nr:aspartate kinase [Fibrobacteraceae bacterium]
MSQRIVCKFGGSSVASAAQFQKVKDIIDADERRCIVVVSAPGKRHSKETKLTDLLYSTHDLALKELDFSGPWNLIRERYLELVRDLGLRSNVSSDLDFLAQQLRDSPQDVSVDYLVSRGEFLCARIMAEYLGASFVDAYPMIQFDGVHRVFPESYRVIAQKLEGPGLFVVPGFYGADGHGVVKTFSRGGSDITGAILANACNAVLYENWTDVSGLLVADPRIVPNSLPMERVSYPEIRELAYAGASVLHDEAIAPCRDKNIPIQIRNTNRPQDAGTLIGPPGSQSSSVITGVAGRKGFTMVHIEKSMMNKERGFGRKVFAIFEENGLSWEHAPTGIDSMSVVVDQKQFNAVEEIVIDALIRQMAPDSVKVQKDLAMIATVGHGMSHRVGVAATLFGALAKEDINVRIIDQGASEINIIVGVDQADCDTAIRVIYSAFMS